MTSRPVCKVQCAVSNLHLAHVVLKPRHKLKLVNVTTMVNIDCLDKTTGRIFVHFRALQQSEAGP
eukprot:COSAG04_NODE_3547_length_2718_cov_1.038183_3_plen_65_part_00